MLRQPRPQDISWFLDLARNDQLNLNPPYQRRSVWTRIDRELFIDTIFNNYPAPAVFLHKSIDEGGRSIYHVVDGKQRLETILMFARGDVRVPKDFGDTTLRGKRWKDLDKDQRTAFWNYTLLVEFLPSVEDALVDKVFERINRNSRKLKEQERRHARFDGWFIEFVEAQAADEDWETFGVSTKARAKRMDDVQFISELLMVTISDDVRGFDHDVIDSYYVDYESPDETPVGSPPKTVDDINRQFSETKVAVRLMLEHEPKIAAYLKTLQNFYSLWGVLTIWPNSSDDAAALAKGYADFMERVAELQKNPALAEDSNADERAVKYAQNIRGASTDDAPRRARHDALLDALLDAS
jgi:hypothetical protein